LCLYRHDLTVLNGGEWSASHPDRFTPRGKRLLDRRLGGPQSRSGHGSEEKKIPAFAGNHTPAM